MVRSTRRLASRAAAGVIDLVGGSGRIPGGESYTIASRVAAQEVAIFPGRTAAQNGGAFLEICAASSPDRKQMWRSTRCPSRGPELRTWVLTAGRTARAWLWAAATVDNENGLVLWRPATP